MKDTQLLACYRPAVDADANKENPAVAFQDYPELNFIAWDRRHLAGVSEEEAFALYRARWKYVDETQLTEQERTLIDRLVKTFGGGVFDV